MKKIISVMLAVSLLSACGMHRKKESVSDWQHASVGNYSQLVPAVKDFVVKGVVFVTSEVVYDENGGKKGSEITNEMLMKEVVKLGGDDIVNVRMDQQEVLTNHD